MLRPRFTFVAVALALIVVLLPTGQLGQAQGSLQAQADAYFSAGPRYIQAADLFENLNDGDLENDPTIISLRSAEDYARGHIPGAVNVSVADLFTPDTLATIPPDRDVVLVCYTGQTAGQATAALSLLGYQAYSLAYGMSSWTNDPDVFIRRFDSEKNANDFAIDTEAHQLTGHYELPPPLAAEPAGAAEAYFSEGPRYIQAADLFDNLHDGDPENDPTIISLRSAEDYAKGHIPGAVNVSVPDLFTPDILTTIPPDRDVVLVCYTGQNAGQATAALSLLGYQAYSLAYGMSSWTNDPDVFVKRFDPEKNANDFAIDTEAHQLSGHYELPFSAAPAVAQSPQVIDFTATANAYFGEGPRTIQAADLFDNLNDGDPENDPYIISLRSAEDYAKGHIPGAVNMSVKALFTPDILTTIPPDRDVVLVCYTGQTAGQAAAGLNLLGYQAYSLLYGMSSWTSDPEVYVKRFDPEQHTQDYIVEIKAHELTGPYNLPPPLAADAAGAANAYFGEGPRTIQAADLFDNLNDGDPENDPYIISLRSAEDYAKGHIPGAVNISVKALFTPENLATIPPDRDVVLVCYTGQTAGQATAALNMLGYDAYSLAYGMSSWTSDPEVYVKRFDSEQHTHDYVLDTQAHQPGGPYELPFTVAGAEEPGQQPTPQPEAQAPAVATPAQNCVTCHTNQAILETLAVEKEEVQSEESAGEG